MGRRRRGGPVLSTGAIKGEVTVQEPTAAERTVARRAAEARATVPDLELRIELTAAPSTAELVAACARALAEHPRANAAYRDGRFELYSRVNVGVVIADAATYVIPTVFDANLKPVDELEQEIRGLSARAIAGELSAPAFTGATFTVWNAAQQGLSGASIPPIPPQAAALAAGTRELALSCDHRILYGATAAAFLQAVAHHLDGSGV